MKRWLSNIFRQAGTTERSLWTQSFLEQAVHASTTHRFVYVCNPKVGCSSIIWSLRRLEAGNPNMVPDTVGDIHDRSASPLLRLSRVDEFEHLLADSDCFRFTFVRNPFDRLLSCYLQKIVRPTHVRATLLRLLGRPIDDESEITFEDFVRTIADQDPIDMDPHWRVQSVQTLQEHVSYDFIGRFESFDHDLASVGEKIAPATSEFIYTEKRQATGVKPYHLITPPLAKIIHDVFEEDFRRFDYPNDVPVAP